MPQYIPSQFVSGMGIGAQLVNNEMDQAARAVSDEARQAYALADYNNKMIDMIELQRSRLRMGLNPETGAPLQSWQMIEPKTWGADIMNRIYEGYLQQANVVPGQKTLTAIQEGGRAWIPPTARFPGVPYTSPAYTAATLPGLRAGTIVPWSPNANQQTRSGE